MDTLSPAKALEILDAAAAKFPGTRADHQMILNAIQVIQKAITPAPETAPSE